MAIATRKDQFQCQTNINTKEIYKSSRLLSNITGSQVQANKAIVGANAFAHEAGIHQDGMLKQKRTYEIMDAESIGLTKNNLVLGKHSGRHAFQDKLKELGYTLSTEDLNKAFERFKALADQKKEVTDPDLDAIVSDEVYHAPEIYQLDYVQAVSGNTTRPTACVQLKKENTTLEGTHTGAGPVDAAYKTIDALIGETVNLVDYTIHAVTGGTDALAEVTVRIKDKDRIFTGRGSSLDVLVASVKAYINGINRMLSFRDHKQEKPNG